jgi:hypothetical protein
MGTIFDLQTRAKKLTKTRIKNDLYRFIKTLEEELAAYNRATLFEESEDVKGKPIGFYSPATEIISDGEKKAGEPFTLKDKGDFLDGLFAKVQKDSVFFDTKDSKKKEVLKNLLSEDIFGLQKEDLNKVIDRKLLPFFQNYFRKQLLG